MKSLLDFVKEDLFPAKTMLVKENDRDAFTVPMTNRANAENGFESSYAGDDFSAKIKVIENDGVVLFYITAEAGAFEQKSTVKIPFGTYTPDAMVASLHDNRWWMYPKMIKNFTEIPDESQTLWFKKDGLHYHLLMLCGDQFRCELSEGYVTFSTGMTGEKAINGAFMALTVSSDPFLAVHHNYEVARATGAIRVPLRIEKKYPEIFEGFGFCTWNAFYRNMTSEKILEKLAEFKEKNIPVRWIIFDDGWMTYSERDERVYLSAFEEDRNKFPEGFKALISRIKNEFGVSYVGVWHTINGFWEGVDPLSDLAVQQKDNLTTIKNGQLIPALDEDRAFAFFDAWHSYLADCGVDFLKVDNQSSYTCLLEENMTTVSACRIVHNALERSINKNFNGVVIDCMGMDMENVLSRPYSAVSRNSDDFFPGREKGFIKHLTQNVYDALWHTEMYYADFDMWWSMHESAVQSGVLRAISGSPVYVSDEIGKSDRETIMPIIEDDGTLMRCDYAARPTLECVYTDCSEEGKLLNVWNRSGNAFALASFNVSDGDVTGTVDFGGIPELDHNTDYVAYEYFSKTFTIVNKYCDMELTLPSDGVAIWSIYPIENTNEENGEGAYILMGNPSKYLPIASKYKIKRYIADILPNTEK